MTIRLLSIIIFLNMMVLFGFQIKDVKSVQKESCRLPVSNDAPSCQLIPDNSNEAINEQINSVKIISEEDAINLCRTVLGDKAMENGFILGYRCDARIECNGTQYYVITMSWLVDDNHWSYIGELMISTNGNQIYSGTIDYDGNYYLDEKLWENSAL